MTLLILLTRADTGGAQTHVLDLATGAHKHGLDVVVVAGHPGWLAERLCEQGIRFIPLRFLKRSWNPLRALVALVEIWTVVCRVKPDVIHSHSLAAMLGLTRANRHRTVFTIHGLSVLDRGWVGSAMLKPIYVWLFDHLARSVGRIIFVCRADQAVIATRGWLRPEQSVIVLYGVPASNFFPVPSDGRPFTVGVVARLSPQKNVGLLLEAAQLLRDKSYRFVVVGDGPERAELETCKHRLVLDTVTFLGERDDAASLMSSFDLLAVPSRWEGLPYVILEAGVASVPVVATRVCGVPEIIEDGATGRLVASGDARGLAEAIDWCAQHPNERHALAHALHDRVVRDFSVERMIRETLDVYTSLL